MTRIARRVAVAVALTVAVASLGWQYEWRTRPEQVAPRFVDALIERHPGTTVGAWRYARLQTTLPSGVRVDTQLSSVFDRCRSDRLGCGAAIDAALADVDRVVAATREPDRALLGPVIVDEPEPGYRFGYVAEPLIGTLEVRYALVAGIASTFVTASIASRLGLTEPALREVALERLRADRSVRLVPAGAVGAWSVESAGDPPASLLDRDRMQRFASQIGSDRLHVAILGHGLYLAKADDDGLSALTDVAVRMGEPRQKHQFRYDPAAPDGSTLSFARPRR